MATATAKKLHVSVITPARPAFEGDAESVVVPAFDGEIGILPGHAALLALLGTGELRVRAPGGTPTQHLAIRGGFLQVNHDKVTVLTQESAAPDEIGADALDAEMLKLEAEKPTKLDERDALDARRAWARARRRVAGHKN
jgi:F-type H+-transporting ATPase subunit epsilon